MAGAPVVLALVTDGLEFSAIAVVVLLARRTRAPRHYTPGAGATTHGYHVADTSPQTRRVRRARRRGTPSDQPTEGAA